MKIVLNNIPVEWKIKHLTLLSGIGVLITSSFLLFMDPNKYTVIDRRVWNTLHKTSHLPEKQTEFTVDNYKEYLDICRKLSEKFDVSLRTLYRALFQIDNNNKN